MMEPQIVPFSAKSFQIYSWQTAGWRKALKAFSNPSLCWYLHISLKKQAIRLWIFNIKVNFAIELKASKCLTIDTEKSLSSIDFVLLGSGERWSRGIPHDAGRQQVWWGGRQEETILFMTMMTFIMFRQAGSVRKDRRGFAGNKEKTNENQIGKKNVVQCNITEPMILSRKWFRMAQEEVVYCLTIINILQEVVCLLSSSWCHLESSLNL